MRIPNLSEIAVAWYRSYKPTEEQKIEAERRIAVCDTCEHKEFVALLRYHKCNACGCPISKKVFSPIQDSCPLNKWAPTEGAEDASR
jgi:hypothetical protein